MQEGLLSSREATQYLRERHGLKYSHLSLANMRMEGTGPIYENAFSIAQRTLMRGLRAGSGGALQPANIAAASRPHRGNHDIKRKRAPRWRSGARGRETTRIKPTKYVRRRNRTRGWGLFFYRRQSLACAHCRRGARRVVICGPQRWAASRRFVPKQATCARLFGAANCQRQLRAISCLTCT